jgi:hypothetical protein
MPRPDSSVVERGPEKAGVGGSIPSLATTFSTTYNPSSTDYVPTARRSRSTPHALHHRRYRKSSAAWDTKFSKTDIFCDARRGWLGTINSTGCRRTGTFYESLRGAAFLDIFLLTHLADIDSTAMHQHKTASKGPCVSGIPFTTAEGVPTIRARLNRHRQRRLTPLHPSLISV